MHRNQIQFFYYFISVLFVRFNDTHVRTLQHRTLFTSVLVSPPRFSGCDVICFTLCCSLRMLCRSCCGPKKKVESKTTPIPVQIPVYVTYSHARVERSDTRVLPNSVQEKERERDRMHTHTQTFWWRVAREKGSTHRQSVRERNRTKKRDIVGRMTDKLFSWLCEMLKCYVFVGWIFSFFKFIIIIIIFG